MSEQAEVTEPNQESEGSSTSPSLVSDVDSVVLSAADFEGAAAAYTTLFGRRPSIGEVRDASGRSWPQALFALDNLIFEVRAAPSGDTHLAALRFVASPRLQLGALESRLAGPQRESETWCGTGGAAPLARELLQLEREATGGLQLMLCTDRTFVVSPSSTTEETVAGSVSGLDHVVLRSRDVDAIRNLYDNVLGLRIAFDREFPQWKSRLVMCKVGPPGDRQRAVVELAGPLRADSAVAGDSGAARDSFGGFTWKVVDIESTHQRLVKAGLELSEVRQGRRPKTRVATVRSGTCGVPTLLIQHDA